MEKSTHSYTDKFGSKVNGKSIFIFFVYFLMIAGGVWHYLGLFSNLMRVLAAPMLMFITVVLFIAFHQTPDPSNSGHILLKLANRCKFLKTLPLRYYLWIVAVLISSFFIEWLGVKTGYIFGQYTYNVAFSPILFGVPIAIGFAWVNILLSSNAMAHKIQSFFPMKISDSMRASITAVIMVIFDAVMEPAAMKLLYWQWQGGSVPFQNYLAWFIIGYLYAYSGIVLKTIRPDPSSIAIHSYFAQLFYFIILNLK